VMDPKQKQAEPTHDRHGGEGVHQLPSVPKFRRHLC
jgi:hypothetical protein